MRREFEKHALLPRTGFAGSGDRIILIRFSPKFILCIGFCKYREDVPPEPKGRFENMGDELLIRGRIEITQIDAAVLDVVIQIIIGSVRESTNLVELMRIFKMKIYRARRIMRAFPVRNLNFFDVAFLESDRFEPAVHLLQ